MPYTLIFHRHVEIDIEEAYNWYEDEQDGLGERFLSELVICYDKLKNQPEAYGEAEQNFRRLVMSRFPFIIAFEIIKDEVVVYAVFHTRRNPREIIKRRRSV